MLCVPCVYSLKSNRKVGGGGGRGGCCGSVVWFGGKRKKLNSFFYLARSTKIGASLLKFSECQVRGPTAVVAFYVGRLKTNGLRRIRNGRTWCRV